MKKTVLVCGGAVLFAALLGIIGVLSSRIFQGIDVRLLALGIMGIIVPLLIAFIHFSFHGMKHHHRH